MRTALLIGLAMTAGAGSGIQASTPINDPIVAYIKIPLWGGWVWRWYIYTKSGLVAPIDDDLPYHIELQQSPYFELTELLNLTGKNVLTPDEVWGFSYCVNTNSRPYRERYQIPPHPDDYDYIDLCLKNSGFMEEELTVEPDSDTVGRNN